MYTQDEFSHYIKEDKLVLKGAYLTYVTEKQVKSDAEIIEKTLVSTLPK